MVLKKQTSITTKCTTPLQKWSGRRQRLFSVHAVFPRGRGSRLCLGLEPQCPQLKVHFNPPKNGQPAGPSLMRTRQSFGIVEAVPRCCTWSCCSKWFWSRVTCEHVEVLLFSLVLAANVWSKTIVYKLTLQTWDTLIIEHIFTGWWLSHPSEKYEFVSWDDDIPNIYIYIFMESHKFMFQTTNQIYIYIYVYILD